MTVTPIPNRSQPLFVLQSAAGDLNTVLDCLEYLLAGKGDRAAQAAGYLLECAREHVAMIDAFYNEAAKNAKGRSVAP